MTINVLIVAGGLLIVAVLGAVFRMRRGNRITAEQLSGDWLAQARGREEQPW